MKWTAVAASVLTAEHAFSLTRAASPAAAISAATAVSFEECQSLSYRQMAERSPMVQESWTYLNREITLLSDPALRSLVAGIYADTTPTLGKYSNAERAWVWKTLADAGYTKQGEANFLPHRPFDMAGRYPAISSPGSGYSSHHSYPGGLITHVAANTRITRAIVDTYEQTYGYSVNRDIAMAAQLLHDLHKPWVFQWQDDASLRTEQPLAGTGEHHVLSVAELLVRKAPAELAVAQSCAHTHPGGPNDEKQVIGWLKAAAAIAGVDPVGYGLLDSSGETVPLPRRQEGFICHLGDHDFVLSVPAVAWTLPVLKEIAAADYKLSEKDVNGKPFHNLRNMVYANLSAMRLAQLYAEGRESLRRAMHAVVRPG